MARCKFCGQEIDWITSLEGGKTGKGFGHKLIFDWQITPIGAEHVAVAGIAVCRAELVHFCLG